ncbi:MAG: serine/threonine-protein kinase, partial [Pirellula sp.]
LTRYRHTQSATQRTTNDQSIREILSPPSHSEMLGRLGRYEIERVIGAGGMGVVLKAFDTELNRPVAIKVLARHLATSGPARVRFAREAKAAAAVVHEHVVAIHNVDADRDHPFLVMPFVSGQSLQSRVDCEGPLETREILRIGIQAAAGLAAAHEQGVIHRDVKPANILLENGVERVLLTDFGLARTADDASLTQSGIIAGTPHYMSPEQANGQPTDQRTDLFSLGAVLYFMATGHPPFRAERAMGVLNRICHTPHQPLWQANTDIADELSVIVDRLLEKQPSRRFSSAEAVRDALVDLLAQIQQPRNSLRRRFRRFAIRHPQVLASTIIVTLLVTGASVASVFFRQVSLSIVPAETPATRETELRGSDVSNASPLLDSTESNEFAESMSNLRQRIDAINTPSVFSVDSLLNETESQTLPSLLQRLDRLQGNFQSESQTNQSGDVR